MSSMKFYNLKSDTDLKIIGSHPQVSDLRIDFQEARAGQFGKLSQWDRDTDLPDFEHFQLDQKAKLTDALTSNYANMISGFLLSEKGYEIFQEARIANGHYEKAIVYENNTPHTYYFLWYPSGNNFIDFKKSAFHLYHTVDRTFSDKEDIPTEEAFRERNLELLMSPGFNKLHPKELRLTEPMDMISLISISGDLICSQKLKNSIEKVQLTGFVFKPLNYEVVYHD